MEKYIVYITINLCNGKFYIGVHKTNPEVFDGYIGCSIYRQSNAKLKVPFHSAVKKYGYDNFKRTTLAIFDNENDAYDLESQLVNKILLRSKQCYNACLGGKVVDYESKIKHTKVYKFSLDGNYLRSYQSIESAVNDLNNDISSSCREIYSNCCKSTPTALGYFWSYEKVFNLHTIVDQSKPVAMYTLGGKFLMSYSSINEAERQVPECHVKQAIEKNGTSAGFQWRWYTGDNSNIEGMSNRKSKTKLYNPIDVFDLDMIYVTTYNCVNDCKNVNQAFNKQDNRFINEVLKGKRKSYKGYIFKYKNEDIV